MGQFGLWVLTRNYHKTESYTFLHFAQTKRPNMIVNYKLTTAMKTQKTIILCFLIRS